LYVGIRLHGLGILAALGQQDFADESRVGLALAGLVGELAGDRIVAALGRPLGHILR
jgi:hypothetical protein